MSSNGLSRRDVLRTLALGAVGESVLRIIPAEAAEYAHQMINKEKAATAGKYEPKYFNAHQYATIVFLCDAIIPKDEQSGGAVEAGAPEFIDLITSEDEKHQLKLGGGLYWLDSYCTDHFGATFLDSYPAQKKAVLDLIAYRKNAKTNAELSQGIAFFAVLRDMACDGFYTSKIGIEDLKYIGNTTLGSWPGCPPPQA